MANEKLISSKQLQNALSEFKEQYDPLKQDTLTSSSLSDGTLNKIIGFDSSNNLIKGTITIPSGNNQTVKTASVTFGDNDAVQITAGSNVTVTGDATAKTITIAATDTTYSLATTSSSGLMPALNSSSVSSQTQSTKFLREDGTWVAPSYTTDTNTWRNIKVNGTEKLGTSTSTGALDLQQGNNVTITESSGVVTIAATDTTYTAGSGLTLTSGEFAVDDSVVALQSDLATGEVDVTFNGTATLTTEALTNVIVDDKTYTVVGIRSTPASGGSTLSLVNTGDMYTWNNKQDALVPEQVQGTLASVLGFDSSMQVTDGKVTSDVISSGNATNGQVLKANGSGGVSWGSITVPSITLNGSSTTTPSFYAPTSAGTSGYVLVSSGSGAPTWSQLNITQDLTSNSAALLTSANWTTLKSAHYFEESSPTMTGLDSTYEFVSIKLSINGNNYIVKLTKNTTNRYSGLFFIEESTNLFELSVYYNGSKLVLRCATVY